NVKVSGVVNTSLLEASALKASSALLYVSDDRLAPFTVRDGAYIVQSDTNASRTVTLTGFYAPDHGPEGYYYKRFSQKVMDVWLDIQISGDTGNETAVIEVQYDSG